MLVKMFVNSEAVLSVGFARIPRLLFVVSATRQPGFGDRKALWQSIPHKPVQLKNQNSYD
jgi:hypothetical protein